MVRFLILDTQYYDGTPEGYEKATLNAVEIMDGTTSDVDKAIAKVRGDYSEERYEIDDIYVC